MAIFRIFFFKTAKELKAKKKKSDLKSVGKMVQKSCHPKKKINSNSKLREELIWELKNRLHSNGTALTSAWKRVATPRGRQIQNKANWFRIDRIFALSSHCPKHKLSIWMVIASVENDRQANASITLSERNLVLHEVCARKRNNFCNVLLCTLPNEYTIY